jgi:hypothetical protein
MNARGSGRSRIGDFRGHDGACSVRMSSQLGRTGLSLKSPCSQTAGELCVRKLNLRTRMVLPREKLLQVRGKQSWQGIEDPPAWKDWLSLTTECCSEGSIGAAIRAHHVHGEVLSVSLEHVRGVTDKVVGVVICVGHGETAATVFT